ncbi:MAG: DUF4124 domain-containing protein, partial [Gammaproteobacteria bacterium]|nr:DUF4124 domain-containing protein [Gammaproteobacteria bacterium]
MRRFIISMGLAALLLGTGSAWSAIYTWKDKDGTIHYSDKPRNEQAKTVDLKSTINGYSPSPLPESAPSPRNHVSTSHRKNTAIPHLKPGQVIMYSTTWCGFCKKAKAWFKKKGIQYTEYDIEKSSQAKSEYHALGGGGVPLILIGKKDGHHKMSG